MTLTGEARLREVLGGASVAWLRERLRARLERGGALVGRVTLADPTPDERTAIERLFGRMTRGRSLQVDLGELDALVRGAGLAPDLGAAIVALGGPIVNRRLAQAEHEERWRRVLAEGRAGAAGLPAWASSLDGDELARLVRRLSGGDPEDGAALLAATLAVLRRLPAQAIPLAELAAAAVGDSHALDVGEPAGTLVLRAIAAREGAAAPEDADERRAAWASVGVLADELSAPALVLNLPPLGGGPTGQALALAAAAGEPYRLSTRQLLRERQPWPQAAGLVVSVCENPSVVAAAANRLGAACAALVCTEGQPKTAVRLLLQRLRDGGARLRYHGDFDWPGIQIANLVMRRHGAAPWRFGADDYQQASGGASLSGTPVTPCWDEALGEAMRARGRAVHEEAVVDQLLADLGD